MSQFVELNLLDYSFNEDKKVTENKFCISCLKTNVPYYNLSNCKHAKMFYKLVECKVKQPTYSIICTWCHTILKKIEKFKMQVSESIKILNSGMTSNFVMMNQHNVEFSKLEIYSTIDSQPIKSEVLEHLKSNENVIELATEVKIEHDDSIDYVQDVLVDKKDKRNVTLKKNQAKTEKTKETKPRLPVYDGKIKIVVLTEEEMLEDRKQEAQKKSYLNLPYKCQKCVTAFDHELTLIDHMEKRHAKKRGGLVCNICESVLNTKMSFHEHYRRHYRKYECVECGKRTINVYSVLKHYNETHGKVGTMFACKECDFTTESHRSYRYHRDKHRTPKVECKECGNTFVNKAGLRIHMFTVHKQSNRVYSCKQCDKVYRAKSGLSAHMAAAHSKTAPAYCVPCDMHFRSELGLKHHLKTNSKHISDDDKRFTCNECDSKFLVKRALHDHIEWTHRNSTKYTCTKCSKTFKNKSGLNKHTTFVHEKKRPPRNKICDHCGRGFTSLSILRSHIRTHTGERPLQCAHCAATFAHSAALYTHNKLLHSKLASKMPY